MKDEYDFDDENSLDYDDNHDLDEQESDEDTEDASETDMVKQEEEYSELKEQFYQDKLSNLKYQLNQLEEGCHTDYNKRLKKLEFAYKERLKLAEIFREYEMQRVKDEYEKEKHFADIDLDEKKVELRETLLVELEDKRRMIESERTTIELTGDSMEVKPVTTRKLRRRPNDPIPLPEKRRKTSPDILFILKHLQFTLDENAVMEDLKIINKGKPILPMKKAVIESPVISPESFQYEVKIEDGKLCYDKRSFHRGQTVYVDSKETGKFSGVISTVAATEVWVRKTLDNSKVRIFVSQLQKGKFTIRRRSS
uniref:Sin3 histone deacetylase corepressor complex component SDS3 n=1 Tax=Strigamia maritima TaxID=126957 RepID=T1JHF4_STRMM